jgi:glycosyltransferase involved in cell wall biosynthesis
MKVSVIIPCYNRSSDLRGAIITVLEQTHADWELIIVDDGSDDVLASEVVAREFLDSRIQFHKMEENCGQTVATNIGLKLAKGDFIALLDSDDRWDSRKLELQISIFESGRCEYCVIYPQSTIVTNVGGVMKKTVMPLDAIQRNERITDYLFCRKGFIQSSGIFFSRDLVKLVALREGLRRHTDYDLLIALEGVGCRFLMVKEPLVEVNWIDVHVRNGARDMSQSFQFLDLNRGAFSKNARTHFVISQIVKPLMCGRARFFQLVRAFSMVSITHVGLIGWVSLFSWLIFRDQRVLEAGAGFKQAIRRRFVRRG